MDANTPASETEQGDVSESRSRLGYVEFIALIACLMALNAVAIDIMLPALPMIGDALSVHDDNARQYVLTAYILGFGGAQLAFGPISDRFGRKAPLLIGIGIYVLAALAGAFAPSYGLMLAARFIQGVGAAATRVLAISAVRDLHGGRRMAEIMSLVMMVFMAAPVVAPAAGQLIVMFSDWPMIYVFMGATGFGAFIWTRKRLPETLPPDRRGPLTPVNVFRAFRVVMTNRVALFYALATMSIFGSLFGFISSAQQIFVGIYDLGNSFPLVFALIAGIMAGSSLANSRIVGRIGMRRLSHGALTGFAITALILLALSLVYATVPFWMMLALASTLMFFFGWIGANFNAIAMEPLGKVAGTGSAVLGFMQTVGGGLIGAVIGQAFNGTVTPLAFGYFVVSAAALIFVLIAEKGRLFQVFSEPV